MFQKVKSMLNAKFQSTFHPLTYMRIFSVCVGMEINHSDSTSSWGEFSAVSLSSIILLMAYSRKISVPAAIACFCMSAMLAFRSKSMLYRSSACLAQKRLMAGPMKLKTGLRIILYTTLAPIRGPRGSYNQTRKKSLIKQQKGTIDKIQPTCISATVSAPQHIQYVNQVLSSSTSVSVCRAQMLLSTGQRVPTRIPTSFAKPPVTAWKSKQLSIKNAQSDAGIPVKP